MIRAIGKWSFLCILAAAPVAAQTVIGGGSCNAATLSSSYAVSFAGHQDLTGSYTNIMQANGVVTFDGKSTAMFTLTQDNLQGVALPLTWNGTYTIQGDCQATVTIPANGVTLLLTVYRTGNDFLIVGDDLTFVYVGQGAKQPAATCSAASLNGVYTFSARGYSASDGTLSAAFAVSGLAEFDGDGHVTVTSTFASTTSTGTYSLGSNCAGTATVNVEGSNMTMALSVYAAGTSDATDAYMNVAVEGNLAYGAAHFAYEQAEAAGL